MAIGQKEECNWLFGPPCWWEPLAVGGGILAIAGLVALPFYLAYRVSKKKPALAGLSRRRRRRR